jgi:hypothetical protein
MDNFVQTYMVWAATSPEPTVRNFLAWLGTHCNTTAGQVMTDGEYQRICELANATPQEAEDALMESAWP